VKEIGRKLGITKLEDWYRINPKDFKSNGGKKLLKIYKGKIHRLLMDVYPEYNWKPWKFNPDNYQSDPSENYLLLERLSLDLGISTPEDWYEVKVGDLRRYKGFLEQHGRSIYSILSTIYWEYPWEAWRFDRIPNGYWDDRENQSEYFEFLCRKLSKESLEDWQSSKTHQILGTKGGRNFLRKHGDSLHKMLKNLHPNFQWKASILIIMILHAKNVKYDKL
jgi:hypothetical protein